MKNAMRARPVALAQNAVKPVARVSEAIPGVNAPHVAALMRATDDGFVQNNAMKAIAKINAATNRTIAPEIAARKSVISQAPASQTIDHVATRANSLPLRCSGATGSVPGNEMTEAKSTQLKITDPKSV